MSDQQLEIVRALGRIEGKLDPLVSAVEKLEPRVRALERIRNRVGGALAFCVATAGVWFNLE